MGLGDTGVDLSSSLTEVLKKLVKVPFTNCYVTIHEFNQHFVVVSSCGDRSGSGSSPNKFVAFLKSFVELGEVFVAREKKLNNRSGVAGGLFYRTALERAKEELLERDAFLFHYRTGTPFRKVERQGDLILAELISSDEAKKIIMAFNQDYFEGSYLKFGMGCSDNFGEAVVKAISEYKVLELNHAIFPKWFEHSINQYDLHHKASLDKRNVDKLRKNLEPNNVKVSRKIDPRLWIVTTLESPIRFIRYVYVEHPDLIKIEFGKMEADGTYHPFW